MTLRPIVIVGPTAGGKSDLAAALAVRVGGEVIGADSMQVYRHLDAGTAKPPRDLRARVAHHLIDIVEPTERFTVADWLALAEPLIARLQARGVRPIVVGGTNLYLKALLEGLFEGPGQDPELRRRLAERSGADLHAELARVDPQAAGRIHANDQKKLIRALEVYHLTGRPISQWQQQWAENRITPFTPPDASSPQPSLPQSRGRGGRRGATGPPAGGLPARESGDIAPLTPALPPQSGGEGAETPLPQPYRHEPLLLGLDWPVEAINRRINLRVKAMFFPEKVDPALARETCPNGDPPESLPAETRRLEAAGLLGVQARQALGYKQVLAHLAGEMTLEEAFEQTKILTRRFAKTQRTWLKRFRGVHWLPAEDSSGEQLAHQAEAIAKEFQSAI